MCIDVLEKENLRLGEEILRYQSEEAVSKEDLNNINVGKKDAAQSQSIMEGLIQTNKEQLQCISILEDEISSLKNNQSGASEGVQSERSASSEIIDELKYKLTDKDSEITTLREEYDTLKQKYTVISQKVANE